ncbi:hypothetical protein L5515_011773 [Caenorhabditis briggsae]|uniref:Uncharacterized protein n=1 Tax=Caenorhabditis briggsae TaxID=6238 RepID=A0AAE9EXG3_CAEBR|nr:hypothetical protein L5515_011773 [Caenorhabditis briggsae]
MQCTRPHFYTTCASVITGQNEPNIVASRCIDRYVITEGVSTFDEGLKKTARHHFAGGDTAWEEKNLGKYKTSETRLIEVLEGVCKKSSLPNIDKFTGISELEFKCASQLEKHEETIEEYYYNQQQNNMSIWLCVEELKLCCPGGHFGKNCEECPGLKEGADACFGKGACHGDGSRDGSGKCKCEAGYTGNLCRHCDNEYFEESKTEKGVVCKQCHEGCLGICSSEGSKGCSKCKNGWAMIEGEGCQDVNECSNQSACTKDHEVCVNTIGSYQCDCEEGYKKDDEGKCQLDVEGLKAATEQKNAEIEDENDDEEDEDYDETKDEL